MYEICFQVNEPSKPTIVAQDEAHKWDTSQSEFNGEYPVPLVSIDNTTSGSWESKYGSKGFVFFNYTSTGPPQEGKSSTVDLKHLPQEISAVWAPGGHAENSNNYEPTYKVERGLCAPDGSFKPPPNGKVTSGWSSCAFVWDLQSDDHRVLSPPRFLQKNTSSNVSWIKDGVIASGISANGWKGSFHIDVKIKEGSEAMNVTLYFLDYERWGARQLIKVMDLDTMQTVSPMHMVEGFSEGVYVTYTTRASLRFRIHQVHSEPGDRGGWAPPPVVSAVLFQ